MTGYQLMSDFLSRDVAQAIIPLVEPFQLDATANSASFTQKVLYAVAAAFIEHADALKDRGYKAPDVDAVRAWMNRPVFHTVEGGLQVLGSGGNVSKSSEPNTSQGFADAGFVTTVTSWLRDCFPERASGGFICVIDNLELLETSKTARALLESIRDTVLSLPGLIWVLCGAKGIVRTSASSPRLEGRLAEPMDLLPMGDSEVELAVERRIEVYRSAPNAIPPVQPASFRHIYDVLNRNLRNALKFSEDFAFWLADEDLIEKSDAERADLLQVWLTEQADRYLAQTKLGARAWSVFDQIANEYHGAISPGDFAEFDFNSQQAMRPHIVSLEDATLVGSSIDDTDKRRKTISLTPRGWLVRYARSGYKTPA